MDSFSEIFGSLFTWDEPVARLRYFLNHIFIFLFLVPLICLLVFVPEKSIFLKLVCLLIVVLDVYLLFTNTAKRIWDIIGEKTKSIYWALGLMFVVPLIPILGGILGFIAELYLLFTPGQEA